VWAEDEARLGLKPVTRRAWSIKGRRPRSGRRTRFDWLDVHGLARPQTGQRVHPLTILDDHSRFLLALRCCPDQTHARTWDVLWGVFGDYGLPEQLLTDNAFGSHGRHAPGPSWFDARLVRLGIEPLHGRPYHPQTQGKVERLHGTLEREVYPRLARDNLSAFQGGLDQWRQAVYNPLRPHEALGDRPPVARWRPSPRPRPAALPTVEYPPGCVLRKVASAGEVRGRGAKLLAGHGLVGEHVRIDDDGQAVTLWYGNYRLRQIPVGRLGERVLL
jgi:transposase InsO family protein